MNEIFEEAVDVDERSFEFGLMLYTARDLLEADVEQGLEFIASQGFVNVELIAVIDHPMVADPYFGMSAENFRERILSAGLKLVSAHCNPMAEIAPQLDAACAMGVKFLVIPISPASMEMTATGPRLKDVLDLADCYELAKTLNQAGAMCKERGIELAFHNHHAEFIAVEEQLPYDLILDNTDPELVSMELDVGWVAKAGLNPADVLRKNPGRFALLHVKDIDPERTETGMGEEFVAPGEGILDFEEMRQAVGDTRVRYGFVECDHPVDTRALLQQAARHLQL